MEEVNKMLDMIGFLLILLAAGGLGIQSRNMYELIINLLIGIMVMTGTLLYTCSGGCV